MVADRPPVQLACQRQKYIRHVGLLVKVVLESGVPWGLSDTVFAARTVLAYLLPERMLGRSLQGLACLSRQFSGENLASHEAISRVAGIQGTD